MRKYLQELKRRNSAGLGASEEKQMEMSWSKMIKFGRHFCETYRWVLEEDHPHSELFRQQDLTITVLRDLRRFLGGGRGGMGMAGSERVKEEDRRAEIYGGVFKRDGEVEKEAQEGKERIGSERIPWRRRPLRRRTRLRLRRRHGDGAGEGGRGTTKGR